MALEQDIQKAIDTLYALTGDIKAERLRIASLGGAVMAASLDAAAPRGKVIHKRYSTAKATRRLRAPKGMGTVVATYFPGNLAGSEQTLKLSKVKTKVIVGAKLAKGKASGTFGKSRSDGYYLHMVEHGTKNWAGRPFVRRTISAASNRVLTIMLNQWIKVIDKFKLQHAV